ncbi:MAG TPA: glycosyltransferase [Gemmatimonadales bacterium]|nr:glycosyltransferase [Gemmatimonadales bacterium]
MTALVPLTVAVAACDRPEPLRRCLTALASGGVRPAQLLVVDQSGGDGVAAVVHGLAIPGTRVDYLRQPRRGLSASRNAALAAATQSLIAFTDDDCVPAPDWLATVSGVFGESAAPDAVTGRVLPLGEERPGTFVVSPRTATERMDYRGRAVPWTVGTGGNFTARREWLDRVGGFDERLGAGSPGRAAEDADLLYRLLRAGATIRYEPAAVVYHERQTEAQRLASRWGYAHGITALCGLWLRRGDPYALRLLAAWLGHQSGALGTATLRGDWPLARQRVLSLRGGLRGFWYGLRLP